MKYVHKLLIFYIMLIPSSYIMASSPAHGVGASNSPQKKTVSFSSNTVVAIPAHGKSKPVSSPKNTNARANGQTTTNVNAIRLSSNAAVSSPVNPELVIFNYFLTYIEKYIATGLIFAVESAQYHEMIIREARTAKLIPDSVQEKSNLKNINFSHLDSEIQNRIASIISLLDKLPQTGITVSVPIPATHCLNAYIDWINASKKSWLTANWSLIENNVKLLVTYGANYQIAQSFTNTVILVQKARALINTNRLRSTYKPNSSSSPAPTFARSNARVHVTINTAAAAAASASGITGSFNSAAHTGQMLLSANGKYTAAGAPAHSNQTGQVLVSAHGKYTAASAPKPAEAAASKPASGIDANTLPAPIPETNTIPEQISTDTHKRNHDAVDSQATQDKEAQPATKKKRLDEVGAVPELDKSENDSFSDAVGLVISVGKPANAIAIAAPLPAPGEVQLDIEKMALQEMGNNLLATLIEESERSNSNVIADLFNNHILPLNPNLQIKAGPFAMNILHVLAQFGDIKTISTLYTQNLDVFKKLLVETDKNGQTPFALAWKNQANVQLISWFLNENNFTELLQNQITQDIYITAAQRATETGELWSTIFTKIKAQSKLNVDQRKLTAGLIKLIGKEKALVLLRNLLAQKLTAK